MNDIRCPRCGSVNAGDLSFCLQCGYALRTPPVTPNNAVTEKLVVEPPARSKFNRSLAVFGGLGCLTLALGIAVAFGLYLFLNNPLADHTANANASNQPIIFNANGQKIPNENVSDGNVSTKNVNKPEIKGSTDERALPAFQRGLDDYESGDFDGAVAEFTDVIKQTPRAPSAYFNRGLAYFRKEEYDLAIDDFTNTLSQNPPRLAEVYHSRSMAYLKKRQFDAAVADDNQAIRLNPQFADAFANRGAAYYYQFRLKEAIDDYNQAIRLSPKSPNYYTYRGAAKSEGGNFTEAFKDYDKALSLDPKNLDVYRFRAITYRRQNKTALAEADERRFKELTEGR